MCLLNECCESCFAIVCVCAVVLCVDSFDQKENALILECKVAGNPTPEICWQKDDQPLPECGPKYRGLHVLNNVWQLVIREPEASDSGVYTCLARNEHGEMKICKLIEMVDYQLEMMERERRLTREAAATQPSEFGEDVTEPRQTQISAKSQQKSKLADSNFRLHLETALKALTVPSGLKAQLVCSVSGFIEDVYWLRDGERVLKDTRHKIYSINGALSLEIYEANPSDSGEYKCVVRNSRNSLQTGCALQIYEHPGTDPLPSSFVNCITGKETDHSASTNESGRKGMPF